MTTPADAGPSSPEGRQKSQGGIYEMPTLPTRINGPVAVIGDVHGQVEKLLAVLEQLRMLPDYEDRWIVFIGDFVDRGADPKGAVELFLDVQMQHAKTAAIAGNHELAMAAALNLVPTPDYADWGPRWVRHYDSESTFESYGVGIGELEELSAALPDPHAQLLQDLPWCIEHPQYLFVHAGLDPNQPFETQLRILRARDFTLNRPSWLCSKSLVEAEPPADCRQTVVSGHVRVPEVVIRPKRVLVDTTGGYDGDLSCVLLPENRVITSAGHDGSSPTAGADEHPWWRIW